MAKNDLQGALDLLILKTLSQLGSMHGYGIARRIEKTSEDLLSINHGTLYPVLLKLEQEGAIASAWGLSDNNRRAKFYELTAAGRKRFREETEGWNRLATAMTAALAARPEGI